MLASVKGAERVQARCGGLEVPNDWEHQSDTDTIRLHFAILPAEGGRQAADPLFFIPGGPGQSATASFAQVAQAFAAVRRHRDIVVVDPRGTGGSTPLTCEGELPDDLASAAARGALSACAVSLEDRPRHINTKSVARDLDAVRDALGYRSINIYAASYGTRVAFAMLGSTTVRSVIMDGVTPPQVSLGIDQIISAERALQAVWQRCAVSPSCADRYHALKDSFVRVKATLHAAPKRVPIRDPRSGEHHVVELSERLYEDTVRGALYQSEMVAILPKAVSAAAHEDDYTELAALAEMHKSSFGDAVNPLVYYSVACQEDIPFLRPLLSTEFFESHIDELKDLCALWPVSPADPRIKAQVTSNVPALLISGENDPVTPPSGADLARQGLANATQIVLPEQGHIGMYRGCMPKLIADFLDSRTVADTACATSAKALPLFTGASGP